MRSLFRAVVLVCGAPLLAGTLAAQAPAARPADGRAAEAALALERGNVLFNGNHDAEARDAGRRALALYEQLNDSHGIGAASHLLGLIADRMGDPQESKAQFERAMAAFDAAGDLVNRSQSLLGLLGAWAPPLSEATPLYERAARDARTAGSKQVEGLVFHAWGDELFTAGDYETALDRLEHAAVLLEAAADKVSLGTVYNSLGRLYRVHGRLDAALEQQLKALAIHEKSDSPFYQLQSLNAVAVTYQNLGDLPGARSYLERALALAGDWAAPRVLDFLDGNLASVLFDQGEYQKAAELLEQVLARGLDSYPVVRYQALSYAYLKLGRRDEALAMAQKALRTCTRADLACATARDARGWAYASLGRYDEAIADSRAALDELEELRARLVPNDALKQQFASTREDMYSHAVALQMQQKRDRDALETAELARSRAFVDLLAAHDLPVKEPAREAPFVLRGLPSGASAPTATVGDLAAAAVRLRSTILSYWVSDDGVSIWVVSGDGAIKSAQVDIRRAKLAELIRRTAPFSEEQAGRNRAVTRVRTRGAAAIALQEVQPAIWRELYDLLIRPVRTALPKSPGALITVVPHGPLATLSFAALQDEHGRYLLEDYALHYVPAGAVLQFTASRIKPGARGGAVMLVADPSVSQSRLDQPLPPLPGSRTEVRAISRLLPAGRATLLEGNRASKATVEDSAAGKAVLHFATHAIVRDDQPFASYLALARTNASDASDGHLTAQEIYGLRIDADLVTLSACRSGSGRVTGDGIATLARAFMSAGVPSLVTSLWDVADEPTNRLLPDFYRSWLAGASKARALRSAQLHVLRELRAGRLQIVTPAGPVSLPEHPVFWAGFALVGEPN
jgi:CHAT domain-containing protein/Tfp pilus assembly protein PilF